MFDSTSSATSSTTDISVVPRKVYPDPVVWWKESKDANKFQLLGAVARKYLAAPASSVSSERLFSSAGNIITDQRNRLDPERAEILLFLNQNFKN